MKKVFYTIFICLGSLVCFSQAAPVANFSTTAINCTGKVINFSDLSTNSPTSWNWVFTNGVPASSTNKNPSITYFSPGNYVVTLVATNTVGASSTYTANITVSPTPTISVNSQSLCSGNTVTFSASGASTYSWSSGQMISSITVSPNTDTQYTVFGFSSVGCESSAVASASVYPLPYVTVTSGTVCPNSSISIFAGGASTYTWILSSNLIPHDTNPNQAVVSPSAQSSYTVIGTDNNGCVNTGTTTVYASLPPDFSLTSATVCPNVSATLIATPISSISSFFWSNGTNSSASILSATATTIYSCTANTNNGCSSTKTTTLYVYPYPILGSTSGTVCNGKPYTINANGAASYTWSTGSNNSSITVTPSVTTSYGFSGTSVNGCVGNAIVTLSVIPLPNIFIAPKSVCLGKSVTINAVGGSNYLWNNAATTQSINISPLITTSYTCIGFAVTGCSNIAVTTVTVIPTPTIVINSATICVGQTATLTAGVANTYTWSNGNHSTTIYVLPLVNTNYTCTGLSVNNCNYTSVTNVVVNSVTTPTINNNGFVLSSSSASGNQWYFNGVIISGATGQIYNGTSYGSYAVSVTDNTGCQSLSDNLTLLDVGFEKFNLKNLISVFPNPMHDYLSVILPENTVGEVEYEICNFNGQLILKDKLIKGYNNLYLKYFNSGLYLIHFFNENQHSLFKFVKE